MTPRWWLPAAVAVVCLLILGGIVRYQHLRQETYEACAARMQKAFDIVTPSEARSAVDACIDEASVDPWL